VGLRRGMDMEQKRVRLGSMDHGWSGLWTRSMGRRFGPFLLHLSRKTPISSPLFHSFFSNLKPDKLLPLTITHNQPHLMLNHPSNHLTILSTRRRKRIRTRTDVSIKVTTNLHMNNNKLDSTARILAPKHEYWWYLS
jgi:hypothetical protein